MAERRYERRHFRWRDYRDTTPRIAAVQDVLASALQQLGADADRVRLYHLWECWPWVMGPDLAALACPLGASKGTLLVGCEDNMLMQEITMLQAEILERVNAFMEKPYFHNVKASLLLGRPDLSLPAPKPQVTPQVFRPRARGEYLREVSPETPWGRCYAAFVQAAKEYNQPE